jgi:hypothetical protein
MSGSLLEKICNIFLHQQNNGPAVTKLSICTLSNRGIEYWLRSLETDETNQLGDVLGQQKKEGGLGTTG